MPNEAQKDKRVMARATVIQDVLLFLKNDLNSNISDPISSKRTGTSKFFNTSYPQRNVKYPIVTIKLANVEALRAGMQSKFMDIALELEIRVWGRNEKEKNDIYNAVLERLSDIQFDTGTGSVDNNFHDFNIFSSVEVDEDGDGGIKSRVMQCTYKFYNL